MIPFLPLLVLRESIDVTGIWCFILTKLCFGCRTLRLQHPQAINLGMTATTSLDDQRM